MEWLEWAGWGGISGLVAVLAIVVAGIIAVVELRSWAVASDAAAISMIPTVSSSAAGESILICEVRAMGPKVFYEVQILIRKEGDPRSSNSEATVVKNTMSASDGPVTQVARIAVNELHSHWLTVHWTEFTRLGPRPGASRIRLDATDRQWWVEGMWPGSSKAKSHGRWKRGRHRGIGPT